MGLSKEEAYKILGVPNESSIYLARARYRKLANRYHPDKNPYRRDYALKRFQRIVEAYVRLQIDPDDCDQMKMKMILAELYSMNEEILADEFKFSEDSDSDPDELILISSRHDSSVDYSSSPYDSQKGPYADVLQDFMIRSYMSGGRKSKPSVNIGTEKKSFVSERARERASQHASELLKDEEEERKKDEKRKQRNKKKKEAKKRKKCQKSQDANSGRKVSPSQQQFVIEEDVDEDVDEEEEKEEDLEEIKNDNNVLLSDDEHEWDMSSAFFAHITAKLNEQSNTSPTATSSTSPASSVNGAGASVSEIKNSDKPLPKVEEDKSKMTSQETDISKPSKEVVVTAIPPPPEMTKVLQLPRYMGSNSYSGRNTYQCELPPRLAKKAQMNYSTRNGHTSVAPPSQVKTKPATVSTQSDISKEKKGKSPSVQNGDKDHDLDQSRKLAVLGNNEAKEGRFQDAVHHFSEAIQLYPFDHRYFGNRSFCYEYMEDYRRALQDATDALRLKPDWPKGFFRKAKALAGLKKYEEAEECFEKALKFDPIYADAKDELKKIQVKRLVSMGFDEPISIVALRKYGNVQDAVDAIVSKKVPGIKLSNGDSKELHNGGREEPSTSTERYVNDEPIEYFETNTITESSGLPPRLASLSVQNTCPTLWVGNVDPAIITEGMLLDAFKKCGTVEAVHILQDRFCAFVTFSKPQEASLALKQLQNHDVGGCFLLLRYPDNPSYSPSARKKKDLSKSGPVNGDECYFWRTTGCVFGSKCRFRHLTKNKGIDMLSVGHKVGKNSDGKKPQRFNY